MKFNLREIIVFDTTDVKLIEIFETEKTAFENNFINILRNYTTALNSI